MNIRDIQVEDARAFLELNKRLDVETKLMLLEPGERDVSIEAQANRIGGYLEKKNSKLLACEAEGDLVGYIAAMGGAYRRNAHKASIVIGILQRHSGKGLGKRLFKELEKWARQAGLHRLELTVMKHNEHAIALYKKMGFCIEGEIKDSFTVIP